MATAIEGLHHVTALAGSAIATDRFFTETLGQRRVKKTVNFDAPDVYHLYYGDRLGRPGTAMTYFPFEGAQRGRRGAGEVSHTAYSVPPESLEHWRARLEQAGVAGLSGDYRFGEARLSFEGPDGERLALVEREDARTGWDAGPVGAEMAIRGFHGVALRVADPGPMAELLRFMGYQEVGREGAVLRFVLPEHNGAGIVDLETVAAPPAGQGAGSVHHVAFAVPDQTAQDAMRTALSEAGLGVTRPIDRDYFWAIYFRTPGGILFEIATDTPGFTRDEDPDRLGAALQLPRQHAHLRPRLEAALVPLGD